MLGLSSLKDALAKAKELEVDLVEISPNAKPPVCRLIDYGKMLYQLKKKNAQAKKAQKKPEMKGIRLTFRMGIGDAQRQAKHAQEFLEEGHTVRIQLLMRGREKAHKDIALEKINEFVEMIKEQGELDNKPKISGHQIIAVLKPLGKK